MWIYFTNKSWLSVISHFENLMLKKKYISCLYNMLNANLEKLPTGCMYLPRERWKSRMEICHLGLATPIPTCWDVMSSWRVLHEFRIFVLGRAKDIVSSQSITHHRIIFKSNRLSLSQNYLLVVYTYTLDTTSTEDHQVIPNCCRWHVSLLLLCKVVLNAPTS